MNFLARARSRLWSSAELGVDAASTTVKRSVDANACRKSQPLHNRRAATARQWHRSHRFDTEVVASYRLTD